jgi:hypothetical protein
LAEITDSINIGFSDIGFAESPILSPEAIEERAVKIAARTSAAWLTAADELSADGSGQILR